MILVARIRIISFIKEENRGKVPFIKEENGVFETNCTSLKKVVT